MSFYLNNEFNIMFITGKDQCCRIAMLLICRARVSRGYERMAEQAWLCCCTGHELHLTVFTTFSFVYKIEHNAFQNLDR